MPYITIRPTHHDTPARRIAAPRPPAPVHAHGTAPGLLLRSSSCACGGSCPRCRGEADGASATTRSAGAAVATAAQSPGTPLREDIRRQFEASLGADLSAVRVHTGGASATASEAVAARAYATGGDIHFNAGEYRPDDPVGRRLLAHEVAHTVQQSAAGTRLQPGALQVSMPGDPAEHAADRTADAMLSGEPAGGPLTLTPPALQRQPAPAAPPRPTPGGYLWVPFDENGGWNATEILARMSQLEGTPTATPDYLPGAGEQSDRKRCGSNAALASAIVAGPRAVITLCQNLVKRIDDYRAQGVAGGAEMPSASQADQARASVRRIMLDVYYGSKGMAHEGGGGTLQYRDLDRLAHWLYVFSYKPDDPGRVAGRGGMGEMQGEGRRWRTPAEVADAAKLAGYGLGSDWELLWTWELLTDRVDALPDGGSMLVLISNDPMAPNARYIHTITFFRRGGVSFVHDSWGAGNVYPSTDPRYRASVKGAYDSLGGLKPRGLLQAPPRKEPSLMDWYLLNRPG